LALEGNVPSDTALTMLQQKLKCGTNCGSCVPELKKIIVAQRPTAQAA
jgi:assimilatory nitrate reductase catalytic subunit